MGEKGKVISIEPEPESFKGLITNIGLNNLTNVHPLNVACWNVNEEVTLYLASGLRQQVSTQLKEELRLALLK